MTKRKPRAAPLRMDLGPSQRHDNGTAVLTYRADPDAPQAPAIRAAKAYCTYDAMWSRGELTDEQREAADRIAVAAERVEGARDREGNSVKSGAFWATGGPTLQMLAASRDLREMRELLGPHAARAVARLVVDGASDDLPAAKDGLARMAEFWGM